MHFSFRTWISTSIFLFIFCFNPAFGGNGKILINTLPKSGSIYITSYLGKALQPYGYRQFHRISCSRFPDDYIIEVELRTKDRFVTQEHINASSFNLNLLRLYLPKFVLHLRDPRQALLSWIHYIEKNYSPRFWSQEIVPPQSYFYLTLENKIDWQIEHLLPIFVKWIEDWVSVIDSKTFNILVTTYEKMLENQKEFFEDLLAFFGFYPDKMKLPRIVETPKEGEKHYRKGQLDEWRSVMNAKQIQRMHEIIPLELLQRFGWEK